LHVGYHANRTAALCLIVRRAHIDSRYTNQSATLKPCRSVIKKKYLHELPYAETDKEKHVSLSVHIGGPTHGGAPVAPQVPGGENLPPMGVVIAANQSSKLLILLYGWPGRTRTCKQVIMNLPLGDAARFSPIDQIASSPFFFDWTSSPRRACMRNRGHH
jgi:hypothetical protein